MIKSRITKCAFCQVTQTWKPIYHCVDCERYFGLTGGPLGEIDVVCNVDGMVENGVFKHSEDPNV